VQVIFEPIFDRGTASSVHVLVPKTFILISLWSILLATNGSSQSTIQKDNTGQNQPTSIRSTDLLTIGSTAPSLQVEHWLSNGGGTFKEVSSFTPGKIYVVEFWATWCGPCIKSMPHLASLQKRFLDKGIQIISISEEEVETIKEFLKSPIRLSANQTEDSIKNTSAPPLTYGELTQVYSLTTDPDGSAKRDYLLAAKQSGIPTSFIVGKTGKIEWIGHPMELEEPLSQLVADEWDRQGFAVTFRLSQVRDQLLDTLQELASEDKYDDALKLILAKKLEFSTVPEMIEFLETIELKIKFIPVLRHLQSDEFDDALERLDRIEKTSSSKQKFEIDLLRLSIQLTSKKFREAASTIKSLSTSEQAQPEILIQIGNQIAEADGTPDAFPLGVVEASLVAVERAAKLLPEDANVKELLEQIRELNSRLDSPQKKN
jgi:thiol-disulfide isomerase/thioredoxin